MPEPWIGPGILLAWGGTTGLCQGKSHRRSWVQLDVGLPSTDRLCLALQGDKVVLKVNKLTSTKTQLPYEYYSMPYCRPEKIMPSAENLGEVLRGDRIENSPYEVRATGGPVQKCLYSTVPLVPAMQGYGRHVERRRVPICMEGNARAETPVLADLYPGGRAVQGPLQDRFSVSKSGKGV